MVVWKHLIDPNDGFTYSLSDALSILEKAHPFTLYPLSDGVMVIGSDYSGQHKGAAHEAYSFVLTTMPALVDWDASRQAFRKKWLTDGRRMSFKQLRDTVRWQALIPFLESAFTLRGNLVTVLVSKRIPTFIQGGADLLLKSVPVWFPPNTPPNIVEKMYVLSTLLAMLVAGLRSEQQPSLWISDHDETLDTNEKRESFALMLSHLIYGVTKWQNPATMRFGTTGLPSAPAWAEDFAAIPDLMAGTFAKLGDVLPACQGSQHWIKTIPSSTAEDKRARAVADWLQLRHGDIRHVLLRLDLDHDNNVRASAQCFGNSDPSLI
jgi:hypothetical protein